jgi:tetratricopeptide (TPR) repeat protein
MAEIALRTYNQEIKDLTDHGHFDEAIAHCQHILETFPRHIETYRLLGKAFLEQGRHGDAADVFQRVLSAVPDDWLSHVGMAIVREDESNFDMAIWHMERAYEVNPSNPTVQQEVRRLRGRRDGVEPPKLRLTRSALARMYVKGGLFGQAIAEIRSALAEDPDRPDLQTLLASALYDSGSIQEAADICNSLLQKLPYCLEANRILGLVFWTSNKPEEAEKIFQRLQSLDPYINLDALKAEKRISELPAQAVTLLRVEWEQQEKTVRSKQQPSWASSLGLKIDESKGQQALPDWLATPAQAAAPNLSPLPASGSKEGGGVSVPSWIDEAAAAISTYEAPSAFAEPSGPFAADATPSGKASSEGELPDWIKTTSTPSEEEPPQAEPAAQTLPDWLSKPATPEPVSAPKAPSNVPDWVKTASLEPPEPKESVSGLPDWLSAPTSPAIEALPSTSLPEWTKPQKKTSPLDIEPGNIPDWLNSIRTPGSEAVAEPEWLKPPSKPSPVSETIPDWMQPSSSPSAPKTVDMVPEWMRGEAKPPPETRAQKSPAVVEPASEIPEWMKPEPVNSDLAKPESPQASIGIGQETEAELLQEAEPEAKLPDWLNAPSTQTGIAAKPKEAASKVLEAETPDWIKSVTNQPAEAAKPRTSELEAVPAGSMPDWLKPPSALTQAPEKAAIEEPEAIPEAALPDWLKGPSTPTSMPSKVDEGGANGESSGGQTALSTAIPFQAGPEAASEDTTPDWLKATSLTPSRAAEAAPKAIYETSSQEKGASTPFAASQPPPSGRAEAAEAPPEPPPAVSSPSALKPSGTVELPDWLVNQLQGKTPEAAQKPAAEQPSVPLPDWLKPVASSTTAPQVVDWDLAAKQQQPPEPVDATQPAIGAEPAKGKPGAPEVPAWLDKSKPGGTNTVARWLDRRLKTSTLSSLDEAVSKGGVKPQVQEPTTQAAPARGSTQLPTWLDSQKPGGSDTVVRWMDKRATGSLLRMPPPPSPAIEQPPAPPPSQASTPPASAPTEVMPTWIDKSKVDDSDTVNRWLRQQQPEGGKAVPESGTPSLKASLEDTVASKRAKLQNAEQQVPVEARQPQPTAPATSMPEEEVDDGAFAPPPEWLQKALGSAISEVPPIPKDNEPETAPSIRSAASISPAKAPAGKKPAPARWEGAPAEEPPPVAAIPRNEWVPIASEQPPTSAAPKPRGKSVRKKTRKLTDVEIETFIREARAYLETNLEKAAEVYQKALLDPASAEVVAGDLANYLEQDPDSSQLWNLLGDAYSRAGRLQDAYRAYEEALRRS